MKPSLSVVAHVDILRGRIVKSVFSIRNGDLRAHKARSYPFGLIACGLLLSSAALAQSPTRGTALFVIRTPEEIVASADSAEWNVQRRMVNPKPVCKILSFGNQFVAINSITTDPPSGYSVYAAIDQASKAEGGLLQRIEIFEGLVKRPLERAITRWKEEESGVYQEYLSEPLGTTFFGIEGNELVWYWRRFPIGGEGVTVQRKRCPGDCPGGGGVVYVQPPKTNFYMKLTQEFPNFDRGRFDLGEVAKRFVQMQINAKLDGVGPPIDVLRITKDHTCWIQHKNDCNAGVQKCSDIEPQLTPTKPAQGFPVRDNSRPAVLIIGILAVSALFVYLFVRRR